jgi:hypothetical protein
MERVLLVELMMLEIMVRCKGKKEREEKRSKKCITKTPCEALNICDYCEGDFLCGGGDCCECMRKKHGGESDY